MVWYESGVALEIMFNKLNYIENKMYYCINDIVVAVDLNQNNILQCIDEISSSSSSLNHHRYKECQYNH